MASGNLSLAPVDRAATLCRFSGESWYDHRSNAIVIGNNISDELFSSVVAHELNHFLVHASTPYGWFLDECFKLENNLVLSYCLDHSGGLPSSPIDIPIYDVANISSNTESNQFVAELIQKYAKPWSHLTFLESLLESVDSPEINETKVDAASQSFILVEKLLTDGAFAHRDKDPGRAKTHPLAGSGDSELRDLYAMPSVFLPLGRGEINIGAKHVFEGIATHHESKSSIVSSMTEGSRLSYWALWMLTVMKMGKDRVDSPKAYQSLLNTFYSLCDLALFVPAGDLYGSLRRDDMTWFEIQPGLRFMTALRQAVALGWVDDLEKDMLPYQEWLSELLRWPSPKKFLELGASLDDVGHRARRHAQACRIRLANHSALIVLGKEFEDDPLPDPATLGPLSVRKFFRDHQPMIYTPKLGELRVKSSSDSAGTPLSQLLDWFFWQFNKHVMLMGAFRYTDLLPDDVKYDSIWPNIKSREELFQLFQQSVRGLTPDRFQDIHS